VPNNSQKSWTVRVTTASLSEVLPENAKKIEMVAVFSERQHEFYEAGMPLPLEEVWSVDALRKRPPQIVIRSNEVQLRNEGTKWTVER
jgi:hypothetical protein